MYSNNAYNVYKNNSINYASKEQLLLMLVDGAVKFSKLAEKAIEENDVKKAHECIMKTEDIFTELTVSLDKSAGDWTIQIIEVYKFINQKLIEANLRKDLKVLQEVLPLIEQVRDLWHDVYKASKQSI